jgi:gliding motility-associated-like protein
MRRLLISCLLVSVCITVAKGQGENNIWCFGAYTGFDFNVNPPAVFQQPMYTGEGCATVSDRSGSLLFYSNSGVIYNRANNIMPNSPGILGNGPAGVLPLMQGSSMQGVVVVPSFSNPSQYYMFTLDDYLTPGNKLRYTLIDMSLDGGMGDVVTSQKNIVLDSGLNEQMVSLPGIGCEGQWIIVHKRSSSDYHAFKIDQSGVSTTPVVSTGLSETSGELKGTTDGNMIISRNMTGMELSSFNRATGQLYNINTLNTPGYTPWMGVSFSPSGKRLYVTSNFVLLQFDLNLLPDLNAVSNSLVVIDTGGFGGTRIGPDNQIYILKVFTPDIVSRIRNPDALGLACNFEPIAYTLPVINNLLSSGASFGAPLVNIVADTAYGPVKDTLICYGNAATLTVPEGFYAYTWSTGSTAAQISVSDPGNVWLYAYNGCKVRIDTFRIGYKNDKVSLGNDTAMCSGQPFDIISNTVGDAYRWSTGSTSDRISIGQAGTYWVEVIKDGCKTSDTIKVKSIEPYCNILENDTLICSGRQLLLHGIVFPESTRQWSEGSTTDNIPATGGVYYLRAENICGTFTDSVRVSTEDCSCIPFVPNAFSPNNDNNNDVFLIRINCAVTQYFCMVYNRYGQRVFESGETDKGWDGTMNGKPADTGTYFYRLQFKGRDGRVHKHKGDVILIR